MIPYGSALIRISEPLRGAAGTRRDGSRCSDNSGYTPDQDHGLGFRRAAGRVSCSPEPRAFAPRPGRGRASGAWFFVRESEARVALSRYIADEPDMRPP